MLKSLTWLIEISPLLLRRIGHGDGYIQWKRIMCVWIAESGHRKQSLNLLLYNDNAVCYICLGLILCRKDAVTKKLTKIDGE